MSDITPETVIEAATRYAKMREEYKTALFENASRKLAEFQRKAYQANSDAVAAVKDSYNDAQDALRMLDVMGFTRDDPEATRRELELDVARTEATMVRMKGTL